MSLSFKNLKSPVLNLEDKITVGKLQGCRVCDVIQDHYEYLIWADKAGILKFSKIVVETIQEHAGYKAQQRHYEEEIEPYLKDIPVLENEETWAQRVIDEQDVPF